MSALGLVQSDPIPLRPSDDPKGRVTDAEARAMLRAVLALFEKWDLAKEQKLVLLGSPSERTVQRWRAGDIGPLSRDTVYRLGDLLGIHKALRYMFTDASRGYAWVKRPNALFGGQAALDMMMQGAPSDISRVRAALDAERGGW